MIDLEEKYINFIKSTVTKFLKNFDLYLFGSRVKGTARKYSDIDIAILSDELDENKRLKILFEFENSTLPYQVDIVDLKTVSDDFKALIENDLIKL